MLKAVIFDMDGLMINTEPMQSHAYEIILREYGKVPIFQKTGVIQRVGVTDKENWERIKLAHGLEEDIPVLIQKRTNVYLEILRKNLVPQDGLIRLIKTLDRHHIRIAVASSSVLQYIDMVLDGLRIRQYFEAIVSGQSVSRGKPFPDIFLEAAKQLRVDPNECVVLEDAQAGVEAGKAAGMKVIAVPNAFTSDQDVSKADLILSSLEKISLKKLKMLF